MAEGPSERPAEVLAASVPTAIEAAVEHLLAGEVVGVPTDTVYGLAASPFARGGVRAIFALKERPAGVALPVLVAGWDQVASVAGELPPAARRVAERFWPGPLTLVVPRASGFSADLGGTESASATVGVRWPDHPVIGSICRAAGPLAVTSANRHGASPLSTAGEVARDFGSGVALVLDGGPCLGLPSTVVEWRGEELHLLREGAVPFEVLTAL